MTKPNPEFQDLPTDATQPSADPSGYAKSPPSSDSQPTDGAMEQTMAFDQVPVQSGSASSASGSARGREKNTAVKIVGGYRLERLLGEGGMGRVYEASDTSGRKVAVKLLSPQLASSSDAIERFRLEGIIASAINHPNCVFVHRADEDQGIPFIAMELMSGNTLKDLVASRGRVPYREAIVLMLQCIDGLIEAHSQGMIHRDIKPANCYLDENGGVKIGDFGLARSLLSDSELTRTGTFLGTPLYASPEQLLGDTVTEQSDIYSLSATLFYLLAGRAPFEAPNAPQVIAKIASADPPEFRSVGVDVPKLLEDAVRRGLARDRSKRFLTLTEFRNELAPLIAECEDIAQIPRRVMAFVIDYFLLTVLVGTVMVLCIGWISQDAVPIVASCISGVIVATYFFASEATMAASPGKTMLQMRLQHVDTGAKPTPKQVAIRVAVYVFLFNFLEWIGLLGWWILHPANIELTILHAIFSWAGFLISIAINYGCWRKTSQRQLLYEWCSSTVTRLHLSRIKETALELANMDWQPELRPLDDGPWLVPERLGLIETLGWLTTSDGSNWVAAHDSVVKRAIWIQLVSKDSPVLDETRRQCNRRSRLRFVESGQTNSFNWNAFVAPRGIPLAIWHARQPMIPWELMRRILHGVTEELQAQEVPIESPDRWGIHRLWLERNGRIIFVEPEFENAHPASAFADPGSLLASVASMALETANVKHGRSTHSMKIGGALPPLRATRFLESLASSPQLSPGEVTEQLKKIELGFDSTTSSQRLAQGIILALFLALPAIAVFMGMAVVAAISVTDVRNEAFQLISLASLAQQADAAEHLAVLPPNAQRRLANPETVQRIRRTAELSFSKFKSGYASLGFFERTILEQQYMQLNHLSASDAHAALLAMPQPISPSSGIQDQAATGDEIVLQNGTVKISMDSSNEGFDVQKAWRVFLATDSAHAPSFSLPWNKLRILLPFVGSFLLVLTFWGAAFRGGLSLRLANLAVVQKQGRLASMIRSGFRALLFWLPVALLFILCCFLQLQSIEWTAWALQARRGLLFLPLLYLLIAFRCPKLGPHDFLAGTQVVPR